MRYIRKTGGAFIVSPGECGGRLSKATLDTLAGGGCVLFADLTEYGLELAHLANEWGCAIKIRAIKMDMQLIECGGAIIKNSRLFDLDLEAPHTEVERQIDDLRTLVYRLVGTSLRSIKVVSLASVAAMALHQFCPDALTKKGGVCFSGLRPHYYGGRKEVLGAQSSIRWFFDFANSYGNILQSELPSEFAHKHQAWDLTEPGFYRADFDYIGGGLAARLPTRQSGGGVLYSSSGSGWYWSEELLEFMGCGGVVRLSGEAILGYGHQNHLAELSSFLINQRACGLKSAKKVLNSIYGRLAISPTSSATVVERLSNAPTGLLDYPSYRLYRNMVMYETPSRGVGKRVGGNLGWAMIISARGRVQLMRLMRACEDKQYSILGVNTDCIWLDSATKPHISADGLNQAVDFKVG